MRTITISSILSCALLLPAALSCLAVGHWERGQEMRRLRRGLDVLAQRLRETETELEALRAFTESIQDGGPAVAVAERATGASAPAASRAGALAPHEGARARPEIEEGWANIERRFGALDSRAEELEARIGAISDSFAITIAFSGVPPIPTPSMPGGHQSPPMVGTCPRIHSTTSSLGLRIAKRDLLSEPPPFAASLTSTRSPGTTSMWTTAGELSRVFLRAPSGSVNTDARRGLSLSV